jgi:hypothetical protein
MSTYFFRISIVVTGMERFWTEYLTVHLDRGEGKGLTLALYSEMLVIL